VVQFVSDLAVPTFFMAPHMSVLHPRIMLSAAVFLPRQYQACTGQTSVTLGLKTAPFFFGLGDLALRLSPSARQRTTMLTRHYARHLRIRTPATA